MLYQLHEIKKAALWPVHLLSTANKYLLSNYAIIDTPGTRLLSASTEVMERNTRTYKQPKFGINEIIKDHALTQIKEEIVLKKPFCALKKFSRLQEGKEIGKDEPNVLIVAPLSGHFATLLRDTVKAMAVDHNVYIVDWYDARLVPLIYGEFSLNTYVDYLLNFAKVIGRNLHFIAVCQPVVPVLMAVAVMASESNMVQPSSMTLMGGPVDARVNPGMVNRVAANHTLNWFRQNLIDFVPSYYMGAGRLVCPGFMMLNSFMMMNLERHQEAELRFFQDVMLGHDHEVEVHTKFYDEYRSVMDIPAEYFLDSIKYVFQEFALPQNKMFWYDRFINPSLITKTALMTVEGELDDISCVGQTYAAQNICANLSKNKREHYVQPGVGHYGIFNGRRWRTEIQPRIAEFIKKNHKNNI